MARSIIDEIYSNSEFLYERSALGERYNKKSDEAYKLYTHLKDLSNDEQKKIFEDFIESEMEARSEVEYMHFKEGVKVGLLLAIECLI